MFIFFFPQGQEKHELPVSRKTSILSLVFNIRLLVTM